MKTDPKTLIARTDFDEFVESGGRKVTPATVQRLAVLLPELREKFNAVSAPGFTKAPAQLEFLARVVEAVAEDSYRDLSYAAIGEAAFGLLYLAREIDIIPDSIERIGYLDDAAVAATVLERNAADFAKFASHKGIDWAATGATFPR
jgi:uncharacterized membrane protein YkvA (DUF1232 family)